MKRGDGGASFLKLRIEYEEALESLTATGPGGTLKSGTKTSQASGNTSRTRAPNRKTAGSSAQRGRGRSSAYTEYGEPEARPFDRGAFYQAFVDLIASGFPADSLVKAESRGYRQHRDAAISFFSDLGPGCDEFFLAFERDLERLYANGILDALAGQVRMILYNLVSYHTNPTAFALSALRKWRAEVLPLVDRRGHKVLSRMLVWLLDDVANGAALG